MGVKQEKIAYTARMIIIGLGNPGSKYSHTRHNAGFMVLDAFADKNNLTFKDQKIFFSEVAPFTDAMTFAKPQTFMNDSGKAAKALAKQYGDVVVIHDEINVPLGEVKCSYDRGSGDHNGVQSVIDHLGHQKFFRIRVGIRPVHEELMPRIAPPDGFEKYMLTNFIPMEEGLLKQGIEKAMKIIEELETETFDEIMNQHN